MVPFLGLVRIRRANRLANEQTPVSIELIRSRAALSLRIMQQMRSILLFPISRDACAWSLTGAATLSPRQSSRGASLLFFFFVVLPTYRRRLRLATCDDDLFCQDGEPVSKNAEEYLVKGKEALQQKTGAVEQHKVGRDVTGGSWKPLVAYMCRGS